MVTRNPITGELPLPEKTPQAHEIARAYVMITASLEKTQKTQEHSSPTEDLTLQKAFKGWMTTGGKEVRKVTREHRVYMWSRTVAWFNKRAITTLGQIKVQDL